MLLRGTSVKDSYRKIDYYLFSKSFIRFYKKTSWSKTYTHINKCKCFCPIP